MKRFLTCILGLILLSGTAFCDEIIVCADSWPPFNADPASDKPGYMIEVARKVFVEKGHTLVYKLMPWARAISIARDGEINGIAGAAVGDAEDFVFPKNELGKLENHAFVLKDSIWKYTGIDSLKNIKLGLVLDYDYGQDVMKFIKENKGSKNIDIIGGNEPLKTNIQKLKAKRIDVLLETKPVFDYTAKEMGMVDTFISVGAVGESDPIYIAFSPKNPKSTEYAKILSDGIERLRQSGELAAILSKYGQKDWK